MTKEILLLSNPVYDTQEKKLSAKTYPGITSLCAILLFAVNISYGQNIYAGLTLSQNFDAIGGTATATLPANWKVSSNNSVRTLDTYSTATTVTTQAGGNSMSAAAPGGIYNFGAGPAASATDRAIGGLSDAGSFKSVNLYIDILSYSFLGTIDNFTISYDIEKYKMGTNPAGFRVQMYYSNDGNTWTSAGTDFLTSFAPDAANGGYPATPGHTISVYPRSLKQSLAISSHLYLAWNISVTSGTITDNAQGLAIDNIRISANPLGGTTYLVTNTNDAGPGSLRQALQDLLPTAGSDTVAFAPGVTGTISLSTYLPPMRRGINIIGPGADLLTIDGSSDPYFGMFIDTSNVPIMISGLTFANFSSTNWSAVDIESGLGGPRIIYISDCKFIHCTGHGAINHQDGGPLTVTNCSFYNNSSLAFNNLSFAGGAIRSVSQSASITGCTFSNNSAATNGGAVCLFNGSSINNCTFTGNSAATGGAICFFQHSNIPTFLTNSTISGNTATNSGGGIQSGNDNLHISNTIIAGNTAPAGPDLATTNSFISDGHNFIGKGDGAVGFTNGVNNDQVGSIATPINPLLGSLANNGGTTETMALQTGSPCINTGLTYVSTDQRGTLRPQGGAADIGAYELGCPTITPIITGSTSICAGSSTVLDAGAGFAGYLWSTTATTQTISVNTAGTFTVTVTDANGCTGSASVTTTVNPLPEPIASSNAPLCTGFTLTLFGDNQAAGQSIGNNWSWSGPNSFSSSSQDPVIPNATSTNGGTYTLTVTNVNGCTGSTSVTTTVNPLPEPIASGNAPLCAGFTLTLFGDNQAAGQSTANNWSWSGPDSFSSSSQDPVIPNATSAKSGTYTLTVTNVNGCTASTTTNVVVNPNPVPSIASQQNVSCFGGSNGQVDIDASGGTPPYIFEMLVGFVTVDGIYGGLTAGSYLVEVSDDNACTASIEVNITEPPAVTAECSSTSATCNGGSNGTASVTAGGGTPGYTYLWSTTAVTSSISGLTEGVYTATVTDVNGCTVTCETYVNSPSPIILTCNATPDSCFGGINGTASVTASQGEGTPNVTWLWSTGATTSSISGLLAGTYTVTATDPNGCTATCSSVVTQPSQILITETHSDGTCGQTNGSIDVTASGGTPSGYYVDNFNGSNSSASLISRGYVLYRNGTFSGTTGPLWDQGNGNVFPAFNGGPNGYVADNYAAAGDLGDIDDWMVLPAQNITAGDIMSFYSRSPLNDFFADSIRVMYNATGATLPADPNWTELGRFKVNTTGAWLQSIYNAPAAGASGRFAIRYSVADGGLLGSNSDYIGIDALQLTKVGGPSYSYLWSDGNTNEDRSGLNGGTYTVTVTDGNGCTGTVSVTINFNGNPTPVISGATSFCSGSSTTLDAGGPYSLYNWSTGATTQTINVNTPGDYTVTVTDGSGCTGSASVTVTMNLPMLCLITGGNFCSGSSSQLCAATSSSYLWSTGATTQCITVNTSGTYTVTVSNASGCTSSCSKTVNAYTPPPCFITGNNFCNGDSTELCYDVTSFGNPVISYVWSTAATTACITVATGGTYTVTVTDDNGCTNSCSRTVTEYPKPACSITGSNFCNGSGSQLCAASIPGPSSNSYLWSTGATTQCITVTASGTYTVTVTDANGCTNSCSKTVTEYPKPPCSITGSDFCSGSSTQLCTSTAPAAPLYTYLWSTGATTLCITVTTGGTYTVTVTDENGCTNSCSKTVTAYPLPTCSITGGNFCQGSSTQLCAAINSGYLWSTGATTQCITVMASGTYTVTVTDGNGCTSSCSKTVYAYQLPTCAITGNSSVCPGSTTQICGSVGSVSTYTYLWNTGATTQCITVGAGTYTVTATSTSGCTSSCSKTITTYPVPVCSITGGNFCQGSSTQLCAATNSGYLWSSGATTQCITVTSGGTYTVTVTNANGCTSSCSKTVTAFTLPVCSITGGNFCQGSSTQLCAATNSGYLWSTGATTQCITVTSGGTYTVTVTNANGCTGSCSKTVTAFTLPVCSITGGNFCQGSSTQLCAATNSGYLWNTGATTQCITVTSGGTYTVTVTNANGCTGSCSKTVTAFSLPVCSITGGNFCQGSSTQLCAATNSGYLWSTGATTQCITVNTGGTYTVTVTNANGCTSSCSKTVTAYPLPACTISGNISYCDGSTTQLCGTPGMSSYLWSTGATTQCIAAAGGDYTVTVTNSNGCTSSCSITTHLRLLPVCSITGGNFCAGNSTQLCATTAPAGYVFSYAWSTGATTQCITVTTGGTYTVNITNQYGCSSSCSKTITVYPTPVCTISGNIAYCQGGTTQLCGTPGMTSYLWNTGATTQCIAAAGGDFTVTVTNSNGCTSSCSVTTNLRLPPVCSITGGNFCAGSSSQLCAPAAPVGYVYSYSWSTGATTQCITISTGGNYTVTISNQYGCTSSCSKAITKYPLPTCSITGTASVCPGSSAQWCAPAGLAAYLWSNGATTQCITVSTAATYTVTVTNTNGCTKSCSKTLTIKGLPNCTVTGTASVCPGSATQWCAPAGLAAYLWSNGATTQCITVSVAGTYTVTVTNTGGCTKSCSKTLTIKGVPNCNVSGTASICPGGATQWCAPAGLAAYLWSTGATTQCISVSVAGVYTVTTTNAGGCTSSCIKTLTIKTPPSCSISGGNICQGGSTQLCASANAAGYLWSTGATTKCITVSTAGIYTITVTGANGCTSSCSKNVTVSSLPSCAITWNHTLCQGGSAQLCAGAGLSSYLWNTGATSQCITINATGDYTVTVTNGSGCTSSCTVKSVAQPVPVCSITGNSVVSPGQTTPICAPAGLTYLWNNGATTQCRNVAAGTYTVTVTNANGCTSSCSKTVTSAAKMVEPVVIGGDNGAIEASAYPNPFNEEATIEFRNTIASGHVVIELFNLTGSKMAVLFDKDVEQNVTYQTKVHSEDLAEGVYFYRIVSGDNVITGKLILLKE